MPPAISTSSSDPAGTVRHASLPSFCDFYSHPGHSTLFPLQQRSENQPSEQEVSMSDSSYCPFYPVIPLEPSYSALQYLGSAPREVFGSSSSSYLTTRPASGAAGTGRSPTSNALRARRASQRRRSCQRRNLPIATGSAPSYPLGNPIPSAQGDMSQQADAPQQTPNSGNVFEWQPSQDPSYSSVGRNQQSSQTGGSQSLSVNDVPQNPAHRASTRTSTSRQLPRAHSTVSGPSPPSNLVDTVSHGFSPAFMNQHVSLPSADSGASLQDQNRSAFQDTWYAFTREESERRSAMQTAEARQLSADLAAAAAAGQSSPQAYAQPPGGVQNNGPVPSNPRFYPPNGLPFGYQAYSGRSRGQNTAARVTNSQRVGAAAYLPRHDALGRTHGQQPPSASASNVASATQRIDSTQQAPWHHGAHVGQAPSAPHRGSARELYHDPVERYWRMAGGPGFPELGPPKGLDNESDGRPEPKSSEELTVNLECKVCMSQLVDTVIFPCGHAALCQWCAGQHMSKRVTYGHRKTHTPCPVCRKPILQAVRIYIS